MRLLIVDDDLQTVEVVRDSIRWDMFGINEVQVAYSVSAARDIFADKVPNIVISDIEMPKASGIDLLKWVRENKFNTEFIFFTCHEEFEFAAAALTYNVISYITKPFDLDRIEMAVSKAVEKIQKEKYLEEFKEYGEHWLHNKKFVQENFWRDVLFRHISSNISGISFEISRRKLPVEIDDEFRLILISIQQSQREELIMDDYLFEYTLKKICSEVMLGELYFSNTIFYTKDNKHYVAVVVKENTEINGVRDRAYTLIETINKILKCSAACYISDISYIYELAEKRTKLEGEDQNNVMRRNEVLTEGETLVDIDKKRDIIPLDKLMILLQDHKKLEISNVMKERLELLSRNDMMNASVMHSIHQDFTQVIYSFLSKRGIQAHDLFLDSTLKKLDENAENSILDMVKWINLMVNKTIQYTEEVEKSMSIVDKAKEFIKEHFMENISRNEVADAVYLSADYLGKMFKSEVSVSINNYINKCRIQKARELLLSTDRNISSIAAEVGFDNISYFSTLFKKEVGLSPYNFRKENSE